MWKYVAAWIPMVFIAIANGSLREAWYGKKVHELLAHQISTVTGILLFGIYLWLVFSVWPLTSNIQAILVGIMWLAFTVTFEFSFGRYITRQSWRKLLYDYNIFAGRLWLLMLIWITVAPLLFYNIAS